VFSPLRLLGLIFIIPDNKKIRDLQLQAISEQSTPLRFSEVFPATRSEKPGNHAHKINSPLDIQELCLMNPKAPPFAPMYAEK